jgi:hypothetical protein
VVIGNITRPNGGFFARIPGLHIPIIDLTLYGATPTQTAGAAPGQVTTYDIVGQYDGAADFPAYPADPLALANAALGVLYVHAKYQDLNMNDAVSQGQYGDTDYYLIPTKLLPLLQPLASLGVPAPILAALDAPLRVLVEAGYDRTASPGQPTPAGLVPPVSPIQLTANFLRAIPTGLDDGLQQLGLGRPFGTTPAGPYGVGGPPVTPPPGTTVINQPGQAEQPATLRAAASATAGTRRDASSNLSTSTPVLAQSTSAPTSGSETTGQSPTHARQPGPKPRPVDGHDSTGHDRRHARSA